MNLKLQDEAAFFAEYQNEPLPAETVVDGMLKPEEVASKINRMDRGLVSIGANHLTAFIDVQEIEWDSTGVSPTCMESEPSGMWSSIRIGGSRL